MPTVDTSTHEGEADVTESRNEIIASTSSQHPDAAIEPQEKPLDLFVDTSSLEDKNYSIVSASASTVVNGHDNDCHSSRVNVNVNVNVNQSPLTTFGSPLSSPSKGQKAPTSVSLFRIYMFKMEIRS